MAPANDRIGTHKSAGLRRHVTITLACIVSLSLLQSIAIAQKTGNAHLMRQVSASDILRGTVFIEYNPSTFVPSDQSASHNPTPEEIRLDLDVITDKMMAIRGLITFGADTPGLASIPEIAKDAGFESVVMGLQLVPEKELENRAEIANALRATDADAYLVHFAGDPLRNRPVLESYVMDLRRSGKPVGLRITIEQIPTLSEVADFLAVSSNSTLWLDGNGPDVVFADLELLVDSLSRRGEGKPIIVGHVCFPSGPTDSNDLTEANQRRYFEQVFRLQMKLRKRRGAPQTFVAVYDAFDPPAIHGSQKPAEAFRGLFRNDRSAKQAVEAFAPTEATGAPSVADGPQLGENALETEGTLSWGLILTGVTAVLLLGLCLWLWRRPSTDRKGTYPPCAEIERIFIRAYGPDYVKLCGVSPETAKGLVSDPQKGRFPKTFKRIAERLNQAGQRIEGREYSWTDLIDN